MNSNNFPLKPQTFIADLRKFIPKNSIICSESIAWTEKYFKVFGPLESISFVQILLQ